MSSSSQDHARTAAAALDGQVSWIVRCQRCGKSVEQNTSHRCTNHLRAGDASHFAAPPPPPDWQPSSAKPTLGDSSRDEP